jgi:putative oxidoreductase
MIPLPLPPFFADAVLLALRLMIAVVFLSSGWSHVKDPAGRAQSIGLSKQLTFFIGIAEIAGALGVALGVLIQWAALGLILVMLGALHRKVFVWRTGFWGKGTYGWHYDLIFVVMNLVVIASRGGSWVLWG